MPGSPGVVKKRDKRSNVMEMSPAVKIIEAMRENIPHDHFFIARAITKPLGIMP